MPLAFTEEEMKVLVLFALKSAGGFLDTETLASVVVAGDANYIKAKTALGELIETGLIKASELNGDRYLSLSKEGAFVAVEHMYKIPITVRERVASAASVAVAEIKRNNFVEAIYGKEDSRGYLNVTLILKDDDTGDKLLEITLLVPSKLQAEIMAKKFKASPEAFYSKVIGALV